MATFYLKSGSGVTEFAQSTAYSSGDRMVPVRTDAGSNYLVARRYVWECTTAGTTAAANPTWPASVTADVTTVTSDTAVFTARKPGYSSGTTANWTFATIFADYFGSLLVSGDTVYVSNNHSETVTNANVNIGGAGISFVCVDDSATPPTTVATGATITTGARDIWAGASGSYLRGITFVVGSGDTATRTITTVGELESCSLQIASSGAGSIISVSGSRWKNCSIKFAAAGHSIAASSGNFVWSGGSLLSGGTSPTTILGGITRGVVLENVDLSNASSGVNICNDTSGTSRVALRNIKLPASWSGALNAGTMNHAGLAEMYAGDNAGTPYQYRNKTAGGSCVQETTIVKSGGFTFGGSGVSHKLVSITGTFYPGQYATGAEMAAYNSTTGSPVTVTVDVMHDSATNLTDKELWLEVSYYSESGSPLGTIASSGPTYMATASDLAASTATWTTTGLTNPNAQKLTVTFTPQLAGMIIGRVKLCQASKTVYVDPVLQLS